MSKTDKFTIDGKYLMLALDHRGSFKKLMNPHDPDSVTDEEAIALKKEIIDALKVQFSGLLIDEAYGWSAYHSLDKPFLLPVEKSGYTEEKGERITELEYSVPTLIEMGASGAKILLYFNPNVESAKKQIEVARYVLGECQAANFPYFLEIRVYDVDKGDDIAQGELSSLVIDSVKMFMEEKIKADVYKLEYPGDEESCKKITEILGEIPWLLLTKGAEFTDFKDQLRIAAKAGCQGFLAGRALWQEVCSMQGEEKQKFLKETLPYRFREIVEIISK